MTDMRAFISSLPNAGELDPQKRAQNEREIERRVGGLSAAERTKFESELRVMPKEQDARMGFKAKWHAMQQHEALKKQLRPK